MTSNCIKRLLVALVLGLLISSAQAARITDKLLAGVYETPDTSTTPTRVLPSDTPLERLEKQGDFTKIRLGDGTEGWVESRFITDEKPARIMLLELQVKNSELQQKLREANKELKALGQTPNTATETQPDPEISELKRQLADAKAEITLLKRETSTPPEPDAESETAHLKQLVNDLQQALETAKREAAEKLEKARQAAIKSTGVPEINPELTTLKQANQQLQQQLDLIAGIVGVENAPSAESQPLTQPTGIQLTAWHLPVFFLTLLFSFIGGIAFKNYRLAKRYGGFRI
ncbi:MAG: TIGR04211 family SH3 domain-containing protein [Sedimenticola sp.]|nr:TIGR04211 family SH3 domain-containing protein [Sedimenticola sp.]